MLCGEERGPINRKTYILNPSIFEENRNIPGSCFVLLPKVKKITIKNWKKFVCCVWRRHFLVDTLSRNCTKRIKMFEWYKNISNSLLIHQVNHNRDGVWISDQLISLDFYDIFLVLFRLTRYIKHPRRCLTTNWPRSSYLRLFSRRLKIANMVFRQSCSLSSIYIT